jgi:DNA helicase-2/ATP-dependent DNA helicase PcrA
VAGLDLEKELNERQLKAVQTLSGPMLIIAGAGSGKTRVITYRIACMLEKGIPQSAILALTFTNKAAREMEVRVKELTGKKLRNLTVSTFHAFGVKILREEIEVLGYRKNFSIYDETDRDELIKDSLRECRLGGPEGPNVKALGQIFSGIKTGRLCWGAGETGGKVTGGTWSGINADGNLRPVYQEYQQGLKVFNALDFDDLLVLPIAIFEQYPERLEKYRSRYRYILVDEFQDTSRIQYRLVKMLARGGEKGGNICVVGDDDQSIYSWRGADYENIRMFEADFPGAREIKLEQNYRSTTTILEAANGVISHNTNRKEKRLWSGNGGGRPIEFFRPENEREEADFIASKIRELCLRDRLSYDDFGVLIRTNSLTRPIEEAFLAENIPYRVSGGMSFFQRKEIKDILSYLRVIANSGDDVNLLRIINTPRRGIGKTTIAALSELARNSSGRHGSLWSVMERLRYFEAGGELEKSRENLENFMALIEFFRAEILEKSGSLSRQTRALVDNIDYRSYIITENGKNEKIARWKFFNVESLLQSMEAWERDPDNPDPGLYAYLNRISLITRNDGDEAEKGRVNLMTIHAAKGLEFPVVFIAGAEEGLIPHARSLEEGPESSEEGGSLEEERRLFYVAITRAGDKLFISSCLKRRRMQDMVDCVPSPFLAEIPSHLVEYCREKPVESPEEMERYFALIKGKFT